MRFYEQLNQYMKAVPLPSAATVPANVLWTFILKLLNNSALP